MALQIPELGNQAYGELALAAPILATSTQVQLTAGEGARFPAIQPPRVLAATITDVTDTTYLRAEDVLLTQAASDQFTIQRAQGTTRARPFPAGARVSVRPNLVGIDALLGMPDASRTLTCGDAFAAEDVGQVGADGLLYQIRQQLANGATQFSGLNAANYICAVALDSQRVVVCYQDTTVNLGKAVVISFQGGVLTVGSPVVFSGANNANYVSCCALDSGRVVVCYQDVTATMMKAVVLTIAGMTVNVPTAAVQMYTGAVAGSYTSCCTLDGSRVVVGSCGASGVPNITCFTVAGNAITVTGPTNFVGADTGSNTKVAALDQNRVLMVCQDTTANQVIAKMVSFVGTAPTIAGSVALGGANGAPFTAPVVLDPNRAVVCLDTTTPTLTLIVVTIQGTTVMPGSSLAVPGGTTAVAYIRGLAQNGPGSSALTLVYRDNAASLVKAAPISVAGATLILGTPVVLSGVDNGSYVTATWLDTGKVVALYQDITNPLTQGMAMLLPCGDLAAQVDAITREIVPIGTADKIDFAGELHLSSGRTIGELYWPGDGTGLTLSRRYYPNPAAGTNPLIVGDTPVAFAPAVDCLKLSGRYLAP